MNFRSVSCFFAVMILSAVVSVQVLAHGSGKSLEQEVGNYIIDVGYDADPLVAGTSALFDLGLLNKTDNSNADFTNVWLRIERGSRVMVSANIKRSDIGRTGFAYTFPAGDAYSLTLRFQNGEESLAEASFPIVAKAVEEEPQKQPPGGVIAAGIGGFMFGILASLFVRRKREATPVV